MFLTRQYVVTARTNQLWARDGSCYVNCREGLVKDNSIFSVRVARLPRGSGCTRSSVRHDAWSSPPWLTVLRWLLVQLYRYLFAGYVNGMSERLVCVQGLGWAVSKLHGWLAGDLLGGLVGRGFGWLCVGGLGGSVLVNGKLSFFPLYRRARIRAKQEQIHGESVSNWIWAAYLSVGFSPLHLKLEIHSLFLLGVVPVILASSSLLRTLNRNLIFIAGEPG